MKNYDFHTLNDKDFEILVMDLISLDRNLKVDRFKAGKDKGVDGRYFCDEKKEVIIQCKHWQRSSYQILSNHLKKTEAIKVSQLNPEKYIFVTSQSLSRINIKEIVKIFHPYIKSENDVWGTEKLNDLIAKFPELERSHYKLWITSSTVLHKLLNEAIYGRSREKLNSIIDRLPFYVLTKNHEQGWKILEENHTIIISGSPGAGKTTLADHLCLDYVKEGYGLYIIENDFTEAEAVFKPEEKQIFYFDDFLGRNFLKAIENRTDSMIINFINRIRRDPNKRFILTTRTNILNLGEAISDFFKDKKVRKNEFELIVESLSDLEKAKILYNHLWFGRLLPEFINEIYSQKRYIEIIRQKNFNPRLISFLTDNDRLKSLKSTDYWGYILNIFSNPEEVWANAFNLQINELSRCIVILVAFHGGSIEEDKLREAFHILTSEFNKNKSEGFSDFQDLTKILTGAFINRNLKTANTVTYDLFNPSIADFIYKKYCLNNNVLIENLYCLKTIPSLKVLYNFLKNKLITDDSYHKVLLQLVSKLLQNEKINTEYLLYLGHLLIHHLEFHHKYWTSFFAYLKSNPFNLENINNHYEVLIMLQLFRDKGNEKYFDPFIIEYIDTYSFYMSEDDYNLLLDLCEEIDLGLFDRISEDLRIYIIDSWKSSITDIILDNDVLDASDIDNEGNLDTSKITSYVEDSLSAFSKIDFSRTEIDNIVDQCDTDKVLERIHRNSWDEDRFRGVGSRTFESKGIDSANEIDDLFSRDMKEK